MIEHSDYLISKGETEQLAFPNLVYVGLYDLTKQQFAVTYTPRGSFHCFDHFVSKL